MTTPGTPKTLPSHLGSLLAVTLAACLATACDRGPEVARPAAASESPDPAAASVRRATAITPRDPDPLNRELTQFFRMIEARKTGPARVRIVKYQKLHPDDGHAEFLFGLSYHREKRYRIAHEHFAAAVKMAPEYPLIYYFDAWALYYLGDLEAARAQFAIHLAYQPNTADSHFGVGLIDLDENRLDDAEARFRRAIELWRDKAGAERDLAKAYTRLGDVFVQRDELDEARRLIEQAIGLWEDHYEAHYKLYRILLRLGETEAAQAALDRHNEIKQRLRPGTAFPE
jgi:tetratricopeptide (TPR) repeat protein